MLILREHLFPLIDNMFEADENEIQELKKFSSGLLSPDIEPDVGLFCRIPYPEISEAFA